jgi:predicted RNA-binding protein YlqC (UPF0109 family)
MTTEEQLVQYIAQNLVNDPDQVTTARRDTGRALVLELRVAPDDMGRVIGRNGRVANAIRSLLRTASNSKKRVMLEIE